MARKSVVSLDDLIAEIEDTLCELTIVNSHFGKVGEGRSSLTKGYYIQYQISSRDIFRAVYLGDGSKPTEMKRKFDAWSKNWRV